LQKIRRDLAVALGASLTLDEPFGGVERRGIVALLGGTGAALQRAGARVGVKRQPGVEHLDQAAHFHCPEVALSDLALVVLDG
jgi:hypothetical protein